MKKNKEQRRRAHLDVLRKLYARQNEKKNYIVSTNNNVKDNKGAVKDTVALKNNYQSRDLINLLVLTLVLFLVSIGLYFYNQQTNFLEPLANNLLKDIVK